MTEEKKDVKIPLKQIRKQLTCLTGPSEGFVGPLSPYAANRKEGSGRPLATVSHVTLWKMKILMKDTESTTPMHRHSPASVWNI